MYIVQACSFCIIVMVCTLRRSVHCEIVSVCTLFRPVHSVELSVYLHFSSLFNLWNYQYLVIVQACSLCGIVKVCTLFRPVHSVELSSLITFIKLVYSVASLVSSHCSGLFTLELSNFIHCLGLSLWNCQCLHIVQACSLCGIAMVCTLFRTDHYRIVSVCSLFRLVYCRFVNVCTLFRLVHSVELLWSVHCSDLFTL